jgi:hypothetical protein
MQDKLEFIEHLGNIKKLMMASPYGRANKTVLSYVDILIDIHQKRFDELEKSMLEEHTRDEVNNKIREVYNESNDKVI